MKATRERKRKRRIRGAAIEGNRKHGCDRQREGAWDGSGSARDTDVEERNEE